MPKTSRTRINASDSTVSTQMPRIGLIDISQSHKSGYHGEGKKNKRLRVVISQGKMQESKHIRGQDNLQGETSRRAMIIRQTQSSQQIETIK
jgi:hypothetical protein